MVHCDSIQKAETRANQILDLKKSRIAAENQNRLNRHAKSLEKIIVQEEIKQDQTIHRLKSRMTLFDKFKAKKRDEHKEVIKRARRAAELRQVIM